MALVFIGLGSNIGDGRVNLQRAWQEMGRAGLLKISISPPYLTAPVGMTSKNWFTNAVGVVQTSLSPEELLTLLLDLERDMGRDRSAGQDRVIDLDMLYYDDLVCHTATLDLPHPEISSRLFVLTPLNDLAPDHLHPVTELSSRQMLRVCVNSTENDAQSIKKINWKD